VPEPRRRGLGTSPGLPSPDGPARAGGAAGATPLPPLLPNATGALLCDRFRKVC
jgi:hypothetical protein